MRKILSMIVGALALFTAGARAEEKPPKNDADAKVADVKSIYEFEVKTIDGETVKLDKYRGDVCLIVNVASKCGLTDRNYKELEPLYEEYKDKGFRVLAFPANNFMGQEPGTNEEIKKFCSSNYNVSFDLFDKVSVKGKDKCPLYTYLTEHPNKEIAGEVKWNFQKYLVDRDGNVIAKFGPRTNPRDKKIVSKVEEALATTATKSDEGREKT